VNIGAGVVYGFSKGLQSWAVGARYGCKSGHVVSVTATDLKKFKTSVVVPLKVATFNFKIAAEVDCAHNDFDATVVAETTCPCTCGTVKARINKAGAFALSWTKVLNDKWKAAVSIDATNLKVGVHLTRE